MKHFAEKPIEGKTDTWLTPQYIIQSLGPFDLDPCAAPSPRPFPTAQKQTPITSTGERAMNWRIATIKQLEREFEECGFRYRVSLLVESVEQKFRKIENEYSRNRRKRIRSIIRRIKRCPRCRGLGVDFLHAERISIVVCEVCGGTGRVKEER